MNMKSGFLSIFFKLCWECVMQYELHGVVYTVSYGINGAINVKIGIFYTLLYYYINLMSTSLFGNLTYNVRVENNLHIVNIYINTLRTKENTYLHLSLR